MTHTVNFSADIIRARVKALSALQNMMDETETLPLNSDAAPALNQTIVFAFTRLLMYHARNVKSFKIDPENFYTDPSHLLMLEAEFEVPAGAGINWPVFVKVAEEFMSNQVMAELLPGNHKGIDIYRSLADEALQSIAEMFSFSGAIPRVKRCY